MSMDEAAVKASALAHQEHCQAMMQSSLQLVQHQERVFRVPDFLSEDDKANLEALHAAYIDEAKKVVQAAVDDCAAKVSFLKK